MADFGYWLELTLREAAAEAAFAAAESAAEQTPEPAADWALAASPDEVLDLGDFIRATPSEESMFQAQTKFLAALSAARAKAVDDGMDAALRAHDWTIGDDPQFGLPRNRAA